LNNLTSLASLNNWLSNSHSLCLCSNFYFIVLWQWASKMGSKVWRSELVMTQNCLYPKRADRLEQCSLKHVCRANLNIWRGWHDDEWLSELTLWKEHLKSKTWNSTGKWVERSRSFEIDLRFLCRLSSKSGLRFGITTRWNKHNEVSRVRKQKMISWIIREVLKCKTFKSLVQTEKCSTKRNACCFETQVSEKYWAREDFNRRHKCLGNHKCSLKLHCFYNYFDARTY